MPVRPPGGAAGLTGLGAVEAAAAIRAGEISCVELVDACLARIAATDGRLRAWACVDEDGARRQAADRDRELRAGVPAGPLHGVPVGVKDVIDVAGLPTGGGFAPFADRRARDDATVVRRLRAAGAVVLGKTVTAQLAYSDPPATRNPWSASRTPGGSSSGSGAAVAARQVPLALATQTGGSTLRPAAYTGCIGFKPSRGAVPVDGVIPLAWSLDHVGVIARDVADCAAFLACAAGRTLARDEPRPPRLGVVETGVAAASGEVRDAFAVALRRLAAAGARATEVRLPLSIEDVRAMYRTLLRAEARVAHWHLAREHGDAYGPRLRELLEDGPPVAVDAYLEAQRRRAELTGAVAALAAEVDALVLPTAPAAAPGPETTGDSAMQAVFSVTGLPALSVPMGLSGASLPLGMQLAAAPGKDATLLAVAAAVTRTLGRCPSPPAMDPGQEGW